MDGKNPTTSSDQARQQLESVMKNELQDKLVFKGVIGMSLNLSATDYEQVSADSNVYLVDMPGEVIKAKLARGAIAELKDVKHVQQLRLNKGSAQLYRQLEDFNLVSK